MKVLDETQPSCDCFVATFIRDWNNDVQYKMLQMEAFFRLKLGIKNGLWHHVKREQEGTNALRTKDCAHRAHLGP